VVADAGCTSDCSPDNFTYSPFQVFNDVPSSGRFFKWVEASARFGGVVPSAGMMGCSAGNFCENNDSFCKSTSSGPQC